MGLIQKLMWWKKREPELDFDEEQDQAAIRRERINLHNDESREHYLRSCCGQIADAAKEIESLTYEYSLVTSYLKDTDEIEALPEEEKGEIKEYAGKLVELEKEQKRYTGRTNRMTDIQYRQMEAMGDGAQEGFRKIKEAEEYRALVKQDLQRLDGERHAYHYRQHELRETMANCKGVATICLTACGACLVMLLILQFMLDMEVKIGYILTAGMAALVLTFVYLRHIDAERELKQVDSGINRLILLQNTVKIRYVNNKNLLDYLYMKYKVGSAAELNVLWEKYQEETAERQKFVKAEDEIDFCQKQLLKILRRYPLKDPNIWIHQAPALIDSKEMVEIRHGLIERRQNIRRQMDYNNGLAKKAQEEIKDVVDLYPQYAQEIMSVVSEYENSFG